MDYPSLTYLLYGFSHKVRTPLAVISNTVTYLNSIAPSEELNAIKRQVSLVSTLLKECVSIIDCVKPHGARLSTVTGERLSNLYGAELSDGSTQEIELPLSEEAVSLVFSQIRSLLEGIVVKENSSVKINCANNTKEIIFSSRLSSNLKGAIEGSSWESFTYLLNESLGQQTPFPPLLDEVLLSVGGKVKITLSEGWLKVEISFGNTETKL
ncbi:MAG: hypothetical protein D6808_03315 [Candidatus Dadabacteria bacterium]|nr:MAG: hypothetical protein D6808_03315 [Candidatus Dadabacteria bacterium]